MSTFANRLAQARTIALERLVRIVQHSEDETQARLAAAVILRTRNPDKPRAIKPTAAPPEPRAQSASPPAPPNPQHADSTIREASRILNAIIAGHNPPPPTPRSPAPTPETARAP